MVNIQQLILPALRAYMGDWVYYLATVKITDLVQRVKVADEIHTSKTLNDYIQRQLDKSNHATKIAQYLLTQPQRLFDALVIGVYEGAPQWYELDVMGNDLLSDDDIPSSIEGVLGILILMGTEKLFAIDGQHRLVGMREALKQKPELGQEEVGVLFVGHKSTPDGRERTRRLFTSLNRYAKPINKFEKIALDEDDVVAIVTRWLIDEYPLFRDKISMAKGKSIPPTDNSSFTSIVTLYDCLDYFLRDRKIGWDDFKRMRPEDEVIETYRSRAIELWATMEEFIPPMRDVAQKDASDNVASLYRSRQGGHILFRPIGFQMYVRVIKDLVASGIALAEAVQRVSIVPMELADEPWADLLWNTVANRMITFAENQKAATHLLFFAVGGDLGQLRSDENRLRRELAGILKKDISDVILPRYVLL